MLDLAIIGGGPAGLSAGLYATRGGLKNVVMFERGGMSGGQIMTSSEIENYPGVAKTDGLSFMEPWREQCGRFGLRTVSTTVERVSKDEKTGVFTLALEGGATETARAVIVATGSSPRKAGFKGEAEFFGKGVSTCATCDGFFYRGKEVSVLGGGDTALEEALYLAEICSRVYLVHRRDNFRASPLTVEKVKNNPKIELVLGAVVDEVYGDAVSGVKGVRVKFATGETRDLAVPGIFVFVGLDVQNSVLSDGKGGSICEILPTGQVAVNLKMQTSLPGLFAAGDVRQDSPKQVVCAAGDGAVAALSAIEYIRENFYN